MFSVKQLLLAVTTLSLATLSCTKQKPGSPEAELAGVWQWVRSDGGFAFHIHDTPASTGKNITLKLTAGGQYTFYTNGIETAQGTYTLETSTCIHDHRQKTLINFSGCPGQMIHVLDANSLGLSDEAHDGIGSLYHRSEVSIYK